MKNRIELIKHFRDLGYKKGAEIGVFDGRFSEVICETIPGVELFCIDSWEIGKIFPKKKIAVERLSKYPNVTIMHNTSLDAVKVINDRSLDFVFIDGEHSYPSVKEDIEAWTPKIKIGGIVSGHDFYKTRTGNTGVIDAVEEYTKKYNYKLELTDWDKDNPVRDDRQPSWYFNKDK
jgi:predicted O-methyltransferase YrrM